MILSKLRVLTLVSLAAFTPLSCGDAEEDCKPDEESCETESPDNSGDDNTTSNGTSLASIDDFKLGFIPDGVATAYDGTWDLETGCVPESSYGYESKKQSVIVDSNSLIKKTIYYANDLAALTGPLSMLILTRDRSIKWLERLTPQIKSSSISEHLKLKWLTAQLMQKWLKNWVLAPSH